jgi:carboxyl-terminal processing protease
MKSKALWIIIGILAGLVLLAGAFSAGIIVGQTMSLASRSLQLPYILPKLQPEVSTSRSDQGNSPQELITLFKPFWQAWDIVNEMYVDQPVDQEVLMRGAINGMINALGDEHSSYLDPSMLKQTMAHLQGQEYEGIGAWVDTTRKYLTIISPMPGSPAEQAGLKPKDQIIAIDGQDMTGIDGEAARQRVLGPKGSEVRLTVLRTGVDQPLEVTVKRAAVVAPTVRSEMRDNGIAYIQLYTFGDTTAADLQKHLEKLLAEKPQGLILDLRYNPGGYLDAAIEVASQFIGDGVVMYEEYGDGRRQVFNAKSGGTATSIPMIVLINEGSASASEIVAGAVQDRKRGYLVGKTSFGKGSVQTITNLDNEEGAVRVTIAHWLTPNGRQIHKIGLQPDFPVDLTNADSQADRDPQLDMAIKVLTDKLTPPPTPVPSATPSATPAP